MDIKQKLVSMMIVYPHFKPTLEEAMITIERQDAEIARLMGEVERLEKSCVKCETCSLNLSLAAANKVIEGVREWIVEYEHDVLTYQVNELKQLLPEARGKE